MKRKRVPFFANKICDICKHPATRFRIIDDKHYLLCDSKKCDFIIRTKHGWHKPIIK